MYDSPDIWREIEALQTALESLAVADMPGVGTAYTPTYNGATPGSTTYTTQTGRYMRVGLFILVRGILVWTAASGTGNAQISVPVAAGTGKGGAVGFARLNNVTFAAGTPIAFMAAGNSYFELSSPATNAAETVVQVEAAGNIQFEVWYEAD